jgi:hypothetical protein
MNTQDTIDNLLKHKLSPWEHGFVVGLTGNANISQRQRNTLLKIQTRHSELSEKLTTDAHATAPPEHR